MLVKQRKLSDSLFFFSTRKRREKQNNASVAHADHIPQQECPRDAIFTGFRRNRTLEK